jgi:hypothetical protein
MQVAMKILENLSHNQVCFPVVMIHARAPCLCPCRASKLLGRRRYRVGREFCLRGSRWCFVGMGWES